MTGGLTRRFILVESLVAVVGGSSAALLFFASTRSGLFRPLFYGEVFSVGLSWASSYRCSSAS